MKNRFGTHPPRGGGGVTGAFYELLIQEYKSSLVGTVIRQLDRDAVILKDMIRAYNGKSMIKILDDSIIADLVCVPYLNNIEEKRSLVDFILYLLCKESPIPKMSVEALNTIFHS